MECPNCGSSVSPGQTRCRKCGSVVESAAPPVDTTPAQSAGQPVTVIIQQGGSPGGYTAPMVDTSTPVKSRVVAGILGILLGWLGVHRFYMDSAGIGTIQLLLTLLTCGYGVLITGPWGLIEGILLLTGVIDRDGMGRPFKD